MPEIRKDPIAGHWVILAEKRSERPGAYAPWPVAASGDRCPFCRGSESDTPEEIMALRDTGLSKTKDFVPGSSIANREGWRVRVVPNKFPAVDFQDDTVCDHLLGSAEGFYDSMPGGGKQSATGTHEVIIETPEHLLRTAELSEEHFAEVLCVYRDRLAFLKQETRLVYGLIFKNVGASAGATLEHLHSQLVGLPVVPNLIRQELSSSLDYFNEHGRCIFCDMIRHELEVEHRVVSETADYVAFCPYAARFPLETWILPKTHASRFETIPDGNLSSLAGFTKELLARIEAAMEQPAYNFILHTAPLDTGQLKHYHWHIEITARMTRLAGFELGTGFYINPMPPELAARTLRAVLPR